MKANRQIKGNPALDDVDHALGRPCSASLVDNTYRDHYAAGDPDKIDEASIRAGIRLTEWFKNEARRVYAMLSELPDERDRRELIDWIDRKGGSVTAREVQQGHRQYRTAQEAEVALIDLVKAGYGHWERTPPGKRGQPTRRFVLSTVYGNTQNPEETQIP